MEIATPVCALARNDREFGSSPSVRQTIIYRKNDTERVREETITHILRTTCPPALPANDHLRGIIDATEVTPEKLREVYLCVVGMVK